MTATETATPAPEKKLICVDWDGVVHAYKGKWTTAAEVLEDPVPGAIDWLFEASKHFRIAILSTRNSQEGGVAGMKTWLLYHATRTHGAEAAQRLVDSLEFPLEKPRAHLYLDDRGWCFTGTFPTPDEMLAFRPWNRT